MKNQFVVLLSSRTIGSLLQALSFIWLSRLSDVTTVGIVGVVTGVCMFAGVVLDTGVSALLPLARVRGEHRLVRGAIRLNGITTILLTFLGTGSVLLVAINGWAPIVLVPLVVGIALERNVETELTVFFADGKKSSPTISILLRRTVALLAFGALVLAGLDGVLAYCLGQFAAGATGWVHVKLAQRRLTNLRGDRAGLAEVLSRGWPFSVSAIMSQVRLLDATILAVIASPFAAGLFAVASRLTNPLLLVPSALSSIILPRSAQLTSRQAFGLGGRLAGLFMTAAVFAIPLTLFSEPLVRFIFGEEYIGAAPVLSWMLVATPVIALVVPLISVLHGQGRENFVANNGIVFALITVGAMAAGSLLGGAVGIPVALGAVALIRAASLLLALGLFGRSS